LSTQADHEARLKKIQAKMDEQDIDVLIATRLSTVGYVFGAFVPWRGVAVIGREGEPQLYVLGLDSERVKDDSFFKNVTGVAPLPGMALWDQILSYLRAKGLELSLIHISEPTRPY